MSKLYQCTSCERCYSKIPYNKECSCYNTEFNVLDISKFKTVGYLPDTESGLTSDQTEDYTEEIDNSCNFKHCKHFGKNPIYEPCSLCNLRRDLRNCYQEKE